MILLSFKRKRLDRLAVETESYHKWNKSLLKKKCKRKNSQRLLKRLFHRNKSLIKKNLRKKSLRKKSLRKLKKLQNLFNNHILIKNRRKRTLEIVDRLFAISIFYFLNKLMLYLKKPIYLIFLFYFYLFIFIVFFSKFHDKHLKRIVF